MNKTVRSTVSTALCVSLLTLAAPAAFAEQTTATNRIPMIKAQNGEEAAPDIRVEAAEKLNGNAYS